MRRPIIAGLMAALVVAALVASYATPLGAATIQEISGVLGDRAPQAAEPAPAPAPAPKHDEPEGKTDRATPQKDEKEDKDANRAFLGVVVADSDNGARVAQVYVGGPAQKAGVKKGDIVKKVNGATVASSKEVVAEVGKAKPGDSVAMVVARDGEELTVTVVAGSSVSSKKLPKILQSPRVPELEGLGSLPLHELFGKFIGGEFTFEGKDGKAYTLKVIPGKITAITSTSVTIEPSDPNATGTFEITDKTIIYAGLAKRRAENLTAEDKVVVVVVGDSNRAAVIAKTQPQAWPFQKLIPNFPPSKDWSRPGGENGTS